MPLGIVLLLALIAGLGAAPHRAVAAGPVALPAPSPGSVAAGDEDSYAVKSDGTLWSWGANTNGELGQGDTTPRGIPTQIGSGTTWAQVAAAGDVAVALRQDGTMWSWGPNDAYQLGLDSDISARETPQHVTAAGDDWATVAVGGYFCAALKQDGSLYTWGEDVQGDLGHGAAGNATTPTLVAGGPYKAIACGRSHLLAIDDAGHLWACGDDNDGELGLGSADATAHETLTQVGTGTWRSVGASIYSSWAIATDGTLWVWGDNASGELGDGTTTQRTTPRQIGTATDWAFVAGGAEFACALQTDKSLWAWGSSGYGQAGLVTNDPITAPRRIGTANDWVAAAGGGSHLLALNDIDLFGVCGSNSYGQTGVGYPDYRTLPEQIGTVGGWTAVDSGLGHSAAIRNDGTLWTWGRNNWGELGDNDQVNGSVNAPVQVTGSWKAVSCGDNWQSGFTLGVMTDGTLWSWGSNFAGQLGLGDTDYRYVPVQVGSRSDWVAVAASDGVGDISGSSHLIDFSLGLTSSGQLYAWGNNDDGQLGQGDTTAHAGLKLVACPDSGAVWSAIAAGDDYAMAISSTGKLYGWGDNETGQLGLGYTSAVDAPVTTPARVGTASDWLSVACGSGGWGSHTAGVREGSTAGQGTLWTWGEDNIGQLGDGNRTYTPVTSPTQVGSGTDWLQATCGSSFGDDFTMGRKADGSVWEFGGNYRGQLGQGDYLDHSTPVQVTTVATLAGVTVPSATWTTMGAGSNCFAIMADGTLWGWGDNEWGQLGLGDQLAFPSANVFSILDYADTTPPDTSATGGLPGLLAPSGSAAGGSAVGSVSGGSAAGALGASTGWSSKAVTVTLSATDPTEGGVAASSSGISRVQYSSSNGVSWKMGRSLKVSRNGVTTVLYRAVDRVGNASAPGARVVRVDTTHPKPYAKHAAAVHRRSYVTLRIGVTDIKAMPTCSLTLVFKNAAGRTVLTKRLGQKATNTEIRYRFRCTLAHGTYRFYVYATNLAGLKQSKTASNRLTVQ